MTSAQLLPVRSLALVLVTAASLLTRPMLALDPRKAITQYVHDGWGPERGLPQSTVFCIVQTRDGYLWLGTQAGLVRFDGVRFTVFDQANTPELQGYDVYSLCEDRQGRLWIGGLGGLTRLEGGRFTLLTRKDGLSSDQISSICEDREGNLWVGTSNGLNRLRDGVSRAAALQITTLTTKDGLSSDAISVFWGDPDGGLWIGTAGGGLDRLKDGRITSFGTKDGLSGGRVSSICQDGEGSLWIGTGKGLTRLRDGVFTTFTTKDGLSSDAITRVREDRDGNLWIGTRGRGLNRMRDGRLRSPGRSEAAPSIRDFAPPPAAPQFTSFTSREGLSDDRVASIYEDREGSLWIGTLRGSLDRLKDGKITSAAGSDGPLKGWVRSILEDRTGNLWVGTGGGLSRLKDGKFTSFTEDTVNSLLEDRKGNLWIGTGSGLSRLEDGKLSSPTTPEGLSGNYVASLHEDHEGSLWIGTHGEGLKRLKDGKVTSFGVKDGLLAHSVFPIHEDRDGVLWLGSWAAGLHRLKDGKFASITRKDGLLDDMVYQILEDRRGNLWMSSDKGVFRASKAELNAKADVRIPRIQCVSYGTADGMKSRECNGSWQPAGWKTRDGRLWFPTLKGVAMIDPENIPLNELPPPVHVEEFVVDDTRIEAGGATRLPPGREKVELRYTALSLRIPDRVKFKYKLEGWDKDWIDAGTRRTAVYTHLSHGEYRFRVIACNDDGLWNETGASLAFTMLPRFWQTWWFHGLEGLAAIGLLAGALVLQRGRLDARREQELRSADLARKTLELDHARRVQLALLPKEPLTIGAWTVAGAMRTATEVGGDYFGFFQVGDRLCVAIGDATGHGMTSGLVAGMLKTGLASFAQTIDVRAGPADWLVRLNTALRTSISQRGLGVCVGIGFAEVESGLVELGMAGIPHPFHLSASGVTRLSLSGPPLGYLKRIAPATTTRTLEPGDSLVLVTDGLIEQVNGAGAEWGYAGVETALASVCARETSPEGIAAGLLAACEAFAQGQPCGDDRTVVVLSRRRAG